MTISQGTSEMERRAQGLIRAEPPRPGCILKAISKLGGTAPEYGS